MTPEDLTLAGNIAFSFASAPAGRAAGELDVEELLFELPQAASKAPVATRIAVSKATRKNHVIALE